MTKQEILSRLPYTKPFLFVDDLLDINDECIKGTFTYHEDLDFYKGHFKNHPITPGVILTETMAQIGLVCFGIYLTGATDQIVMLSSCKIEFLKPVYPGEKVTVTSTKNYFRFDKLSCKVIMENEAGEVVCKGEIAGMSITNSDGK